MQCWQCGKPVRPEAKLCIYCGTRLTSDDAPQPYPASYERERDGRAESHEDGAFGGRSASERDRDAPYGPRRESQRGSSERSHEAGWGGDEPDSQRYVPGRSGNQAPDVRAAARRSVAPRTSSQGADNRPLDPLDDPRAPRSLRSSPAAPREPERRQGTFAYDGNRSVHGRGSDGGQGRRGGYEHQGRYYTQGDLGYDPRYDPESGEYDAVADGRRREERLAQDDARRDGRDGYERRTGGARDGRRDADHSGAPGGWDDGRERRLSAQGYRDGRGGSDDAPSAEYSAEYAANYPARYDDERNRRYSSGYSDELDPRYSSGYSDELDPRVVHGGNWNDYRSGSRGYDESAEWDARGPAPRRAPNSPAEDSWNLPAISQAQLPAAGWSDEWSAAGRQGPGQALATPARRGAPRDSARRNGKRARGRGLTAVAIGLVALIAVAVVIVGITERGAILSRLPGAAQTSAHPFATYTPGATPTPVATYKEFSSQNSRYVLNYPGQWSAQTSSQPNTGYDYVDTFTQQNPYTAVIVEQAAAFANIADTEIATAEINGGKQGGRTFTDTPAAAATMNIGGEVWTRREFDVTDVKTSTTLHMAILTCHHGDRGYAMVLVATPDAFAKDDGTVFKTVLNSFRFAS